MNKRELMLAAVSMIMIASPTATSQETVKDTPYWSYKETDHWGSLHPSFAACESGRAQSPINIKLDHVKVDQTAEPVLHYSPTVMTVMNTGRTIQVNTSSAGNFITVDGKNYPLVHMHFHQPGEHQVNGNSFAMEGHLVHRNRAGEFAVIAFFIQEGKKNKQLAEMWSKLPKQEAAEDVKLNNRVDLVRLLPQDKTAFRYNGSFSIPPCTEGVKWIVLQTPIEMSKQQIAAFGAIFSDNRRPVQPLNERDVWLVEVK